MFPASSRRGFLQTLLYSAAAMPALGTDVFGQRSAEGPGPAPAGHLTFTRIGDTIGMISGAGGNVLVADSPDGLLMVNGGARAHADQLLAEVGTRFGGKRVRMLFNTDWHPEHTGSNGAVRHAGGDVIAHENTKQYLSANLTVEWQQRTFTALPKDALPTRTFYAGDTITFGGNTVEYGPLGQAHTDGDIYVFFRELNVLVAGDLLSVGAYPIADYTTGGWLGGLATATKTLLDMTNAETKVVAGSGPLRTRADVEAQHQMLLTARDRIGKMMRQGLGADDMLAAGVTKEFDATWGDPQLFVTTSYRGMWLHVRELGGVV
jgi:glyoxylase-like metal-dependent hydrolase (beta-lactamase superfamily II)